MSHFRWHRTKPQEQATTALRLYSEAWMSGLKTVHCASLKACAVIFFFAAYLPDPKNPGSVLLKFL